MIFDGNVACCDIADHFRDEQRRNTSGAFFFQRFIGFSKCFKTTDTAAKVYAQFFRGDFAFQFAVSHGFCRRCQRILCETVQLLCGQFIHAAQRIEILYFCCQFIFGFGYVKTGDHADAVFACFQTFPEISHVVADGSYRTQTCYYDSFHKVPPTWPDRRRCGSLRQ